MAKIYARLCKDADSGWTLEMVPERWRAEVQKILSEG